MKIYIYGAGLIAKRIAYHLNNKIVIKGYIETSPTQRVCLGGVKTISIDEIDDDYDYIVIGSSHVKEIMKNLTSHNIPNNKIICYWDEEACTAQIDDRLATMRCIAEDLHERGICGAVAELGVYKGEFSQYINEAFPDSSLYLFDTFEGFDERDVEADNKSGIKGENIKKGGLKFCDIEHILSKLPHREKAIIKKGYFPDTAKDVRDEFIFVNIDVDLYQPIYEGLKFFWPLMKQGGSILVHDYGASQWGGAKLAVQKFSEEKKVAFVPLPDYGGSVIFVKS